LAAHSGGARLAQFRLPNSAFPRKVRKAAASRWPLAINCEREETGETRNVSETANELFGELVAIMARLRGENGCPWDREQTHESIKPYFVEETYEVLEAIDEGNAGKLREELGDVMLQVVFHARMAEEAGLFSIADALTAINQKLIRRHPHVFGDVRADTPQEVLFNWEQIKKTERTKANGQASALDGVPRELPALLRAHRLQEKASRMGFDWKEAQEVLLKVDEELNELRSAMQSEQADRMEAELGDLLFSLVNLSRFIAVNPEEALRKTIARFISRFRYIEEALARQGKSPSQVTLQEMDALWDEAKARNREG
jgi:tetrapyrrole methylase family protein/MazG family protein